jgi:hypothetical protein
MRGGLPFDDWNTMRPELEEELDGACAAREQVERRLAELADDHVDDALAATMIELNAAIAAQLQASGSIDDVRMLLRRLFAHFVLHANNDELVLVPELRPDALEQLLGAENRTALRLTTAHDGLPSRSIPMRRSC